MHSLSRYSSSISSFQPRFLTLGVVLLLAFGMSALGCGDGDEVEKHADIAIASMEPSAGYPDIEFELHFDITPGENTSEDELSWRVNFGDGQSRLGESTHGMVSHSYELSGEYLIEVSAMVDNRAIATVTETYRVYEPVDIHVSNTRGAPGNVQTGDSLTVSFTVANATASPVETPFSVRMFLSQSAEVTEEGLETLTTLGDAEVSAEQGSAVIASGQERNIGANVTVPDVSGGSYYLVTLVDAEGLIADTDRSNNLNVSQNVIFIENLDQILPDISVEGVYAFPDRSFPTLSRVTRGFTLANRGSEDVFDVVYKTYLSIGDDVLSEDDLLIHTSSPVSLSARSERVIDPEQIILTDEIVPEEGEELSVYLIVEARSTDSSVVEIDDENNVGAAIAPIIVSDQLVDGPDIAVKEFDVTPESTFLNGTLEIKTEIANEGNMDVGSFFCGIYMGTTPQINIDLDPRLTNINISSLASGETRVIERNIIVPGLHDPGQYYLYIVCDPMGALSEAYRSNNQKVYLNPITITDEADVDMYVEKLDVPASSLEGEEFTITATICVVGSNPTGVTRGHLFRSPGQSVSFQGDPVLAFDIPNINPGQCEDVPLTLEAECDDFQQSYSFGIVVDATDRLPELDESNNQLAGSNSMIVEGEYCACLDDGFGPNQRPLDAALVESGDLSASVCTPGSCDYFAVDLELNDSVIITNSFLSDKGRLVTTLFDESGLRVLDRDSSESDLHQVASFLVPKAERYIFAVCGAQSTSRNLYHLNVEVIAQPDEVDVLPYDIRIPPRDSFTVGTSLDVRARVYNLGKMPTEAFDAHVVLTETPSVGNATDRVIATQNIAALGAGSFREVTIPATLPVAIDDGEYSLAVVLDPLDQLDDSNPDNNMAFSRRINVDSDCYDPFQPNNSFAEATPITPGTYSNLVSCTGASDYYEICVDDGKKVSASVSFNDSNGDIDVELFNDHFTRIASSINSGVDVEQVSVDYVNGSQCYYLRVYMLEHPGNPHRQNNYDLTVDIQDVDPSLQCDSAFEPNDSFATASSLLSALQHPVLLDRCPVADTDFYYVHLSAGQKITLRGLLEPDNQPGTLRLQLYRPNQTPGPNMETAPGIPVAEIKDYIAPQSGQFYLQVTISGSTRRVTYSLEAEGLGGVDLKASNLVIGPGSYEANDQVRFAFDITNLRSGDASSPVYEVYLSDSSTLDKDNDELLGTFVAPDVAGNSTVNVDDRINLPDSVTAGTGYLHIIVDPDDLLDDLNLANNLTHTTIQLK